jgi:hypothetical protein
MFKPRRDFLCFLLKGSALLAQVVSCIPWNARADAIVGASASPVFERCVGRAILPGEDSTVLIIGSNMLSVQSVFFQNRHIAATILEHDDSHLMLRMRTSDQWRPGAREMWVRTFSGMVMPVPIALVADKDGRLVAKYGPKAYPKYGPKPYRPPSPYGPQTLEEGPAEFPTLSAIGAHLL